MRDEWHCRFSRDKARLAPIEVPPEALICGLRRKLRLHAGAIAMLPGVGRGFRQLPKVNPAYRQPWGDWAPALPPEWRALGARAARLLQNDFARHRPGLG